ncbi:MAG: hypothetical protein KAI66_05600, partial [Lentisphaeria bacterium]|nr:hypothetical protein [Lentisphaeria bacterium]
MHVPIQRLLPLLCVCLSCWGADYYVLPFKPDPAIVADADLADWVGVPNTIVLKGTKQVTYGRDVWDGDTDLSAVIRLAWRPGQLAIAAEVTDDSFRQPYTGSDIWKGDHLNLWMDFMPGVDPRRHMFGKGQFHVVVSPGNLAGNPPEIYVYRPEGQNPGPGKVAARRTKNGYVLEATIPIARLGMKRIAMHSDANFEVAISDADGDPARQQTLITMGTDKWVYSRSRTLPMVFGDGNGKAPPPLRGMSIAEHAEIAPGESVEFTFQAEAIPEGKQPFVFFKAMLPRKKVAGFRGKTLALDLNGKRVSGKRLSNRPMRAEIMRGTNHVFVTPAGEVTVYYTPDYRALTNHSIYGSLDRSKPCEYEFGIAGLVREGKNTLVIHNLCQAQDDTPLTVKIDGLEYRIKQEPPPKRAPKPAPTGTIPTLTPAKTFPKTYTLVSQTTSDITFEVNGRQRKISSRYSTPDGQWQSASNGRFTVARRVIEHDEWIEVEDTFQNVSGANLPLMQEHMCVLGEAFAEAWLGGLKMTTGNGDRSIAANPSAFATTDTFGVGLFPLNDTFLVHSRQRCERRRGMIEISDRELYLKPGASYTASFAIVPVDKPDFWRFINASRRLRKVNFQLKWMFAFMVHHWPVYEWTDKRFRGFIDGKGTNFVVQSNTVRNKRRRYARATDWLNADLSLFRDFQTRVRGFYPGGSVKTGIYYHCFLDTTRENDELYKADRGLDSAGNHINYGGKGAYMHYFIPTLEAGHWGGVMEKVLTTILDDIKADGVFWDEFSYSRTPYVYGREDGCSADLDPETHTIIRTKASVPLVSLPFRVKQVDRILAGNHPFVINGAPRTRTMVDKHFMAFTESGSMTNCRRMLLHSPVALGDHLTEKTYADSYANMHAALDHGCLFVWYSHIFHNNVAPTHFMFPCTPIELHSGTIIGQERIVTNRSGLVGWGDASSFTTHVFDRGGILASDFRVPIVNKDNQTFAE